jgi:hypothetical protein
MLDADLADPTILDRLTVLVASLQDERRRLAMRLSEIETELVRLASAVAAQEPRFDDLLASRRR